MKKYLLSIFTVFAITACVDKVPEELPPLNLEGRTIVEAKIESILLGNDSRVWPEGSAIGVSGSEDGTNLKYLLRKADAALSEAVFYGPKVAGDISAYYPWDESYTGSWGRMTSALDSRQAYTQANGPLEQFLAYSPVAYGFESAGKLSFEYPYGMLAIKVALEEDLKVEGITLSCEDLPFAGTGIVTPEGIQFGNGASHGLELVFDQPVSIRDKSGNLVPFYIVLPPFEYPDLEIAFYFTGEQPFVCSIAGVSVPRVAAETFSMLSMVIGSDGPEGFTPVNVQFDEN
ncbi:MAG: fimbrillin family protein [Bacteroidales bacterium]|nr:fimbrillin family protein [Bacteroidales bacterium]